MMWHIAQRILVHVPKVCKIGLCNGSYGFCSLTFDRTLYYNIEIYSVITETIRRGKVNVTAIRNVDRDMQEREETMIK